MTGVNTAHLTASQPPITWWTTTIATTTVTMTTTTTIMIYSDMDDLGDLGVICKLFSEDLEIYLRIINAYDLTTLQMAVDALADWENMWQLSVSSSKCSVLFVGNKCLAYAKRPCDCSVLCLYVRRVHCKVVPTLFFRHDVIRQRFSLSRQRA